MVKLTEAGKKKRMKARRKELRLAAITGEPVGAPQGAEEFLKGLHPPERLKAVREPTHWPYVWLVPETLHYYLDVPGQKLFSHRNLAEVLKEIGRRTGLVIPKNPWRKPGVRLHAALREALRATCSGEVG